MKDQHKYQPPGWAQRLLEWYCKPALLEDLQGDLNEYFDRNVKSKGPFRAKLIYIADVIRFFRPYTIRKPEFISLLIAWIMLGSHIKTSRRSIAHHKLFSFINVFGLAVSMSVGLLLIALLTDMLRYDRFHEKGDRIYRVISTYQYLNQNENRFASTSPMAGNEIKETVPGIEDVVIFTGGFGSDLHAGDKPIPLFGLWANESIFNVFTFQLLKGNPTTALKNPFSIVLTETAAKRLFGDEEAMGKTVIAYFDQEYTVTGVVKDPPKFSHLKFDILAAYSTREITRKEQWRQEMRWDNIWSNYTYLLLPEDADIDNIEHNLAVLSAKNDKTVEHTKIHLSLQPLHNIAFGDDLSNQAGDVLLARDVWMVGLLSVIVILSACFNYTNLSMARATRRSHEIGVRKVVGASKRHVLGQFIVEAIMISLLALVLSLLLFVLLKPYFLALQPTMGKMLRLDLSLGVVVYFVAFAACVGIVAGLLPAVVFSKIKAIQVLKDASSLRLLSHLNLRKALIVLQYSISLAFITATILGFKQYKFLLDFNLGYDTENIVNIYLHGNEKKAEQLANELLKIPEVQGVSQSLIVTSLGNYWGARVKYKDPLDSASPYYNGIDENYIPLHNIRLIAGRNFTPLADSAVESEVIVNEEVLKRFKIGNGDPLRAIDEILIVDRKPMKIVGVLKDFHYGKADREKSETIFRYHKNSGNFVNAKVVTNDWSGTLAKIESVWKGFDDVHHLDAQLYRDGIAHSYQENFGTLKVMGFLAFLAICIASLGLLGMVIFIAETRLKEISIRKVLGASERGLIYLLSKGFFFLLLVSGAIALPVTYILFDKVVLAEHQNRVTINLVDLFLGFAGVLVVAFILIGSQTIKVARKNPAEVLKNTSR